jgi:dephospho-CoA kinase
VSDYVVGLTGGIGSGKSTVADLFVAQGIVLVDTDAIAHELSAAGGAAMPALVEAFGAGVADANGALDRGVMRRLVFADPAARLRLESILHPMIRTLSAERCQEAGSPYVILAVPLLVESGTYRQRCDRILVVDCPETLQIERVIARNGMSVDQVQAILATQATRAQRLAIADDVLVNDAERQLLDRQVGDLHAKYLQLAAKKLKASC